MMQATLTGAFPHSEELVKAFRERARGRITAEELRSAVESDLSALLALQRDCGFGQLTDGLLEWGDLLRPFSSLGGIERGSLTRWFNNNTFYWAPKVTGRVEWKQSVLRGLVDRRANNVIVPGPYTFSRLSENVFYRERDGLMLDFAKALNRELRGANAEHVQLSEPSLVFRPPGKDGLESAKEAVEIALKGVKAETLLHTYFGSIAPIYPSILEFPVDFIGVDFFETDVKSLEGPFTRGLACGAVNARNAVIESPGDIADSLRLAEALEPKDALLCPNAALDLRPRAVAEKKMASMAAVLKTAGVEA